MKKLNLLLTLSMALLCTTQPTKAENSSWTSWFAPAAAALGALYAGYQYYSQHQLLNNVVKPNINALNNIEQSIETRSQDNTINTKKKKTITDNLNSIKPLDKSLGFEFFEKDYIDNMKKNCDQILLASDKNNYGRPSRALFDPTDPQHGAYQFASSYKRYRNLNIKRRSQLLASRQNWGITAGTFSALTFGLVAYNLK